jgi:hypothetical protein
VSGQLHAPCRLNVRETDSGTPCIAVWVDPRTDLDRSERYALEKSLLRILGIEPRISIVQARSLEAIPTESFPLAMLINSDNENCTYFCLQSLFAYVLSNVALM